MGPEVVVATKKVLEKLADKHNFSIEWQEFPHGADHYLSTGEVLPDEAIEEMRKNEAILLGALGDPRVTPGILEKGILLRLRFAFDQYVNLRPVRFFNGVDSPISTENRENLAIYFVRENTEDFYVGLGNRFTGKHNVHTLVLDRLKYKIRFNIDVEMEGEEEGSYQLGVISKGGAKRVIQYAFALARKKGMNMVTCVDKANVLTEMYGLWRDVFSGISKDNPDIEANYGFVDAVAMNLVRKPEIFQVIVTPNLFGDILTDLGAGIQGSLGLSPSANINPEGISMFEPVHGSAPKYQGLGVANPVATILAGQMMLDEIGEKEAAKELETAVYSMLSEKKVRTPDLGGKARTMDIADAVIAKL